MGRRGGGFPSLREVVDSLDLDAGLDLESLRRQVAARRGTAVVLIAVAGFAGVPCGGWLSRDDGVDLVFYDAGASEVHRQHIVLHEFAHMLLGHGGPGPRSGVEGLLQRVDPRTAALMLSRAEYASEPERAAERLAMAIVQRARAVSRAAPAGGDPRLARLERALGDGACS